MHYFWRRKLRESRSKRRVEAFVHRQDGREIKALVTNISNRACELRPQELLSVDERIRIEIPRLGSIAAAIRWISDEHAGAEFLPPKPRLGRMHRRPPAHLELKPVFPDPSGVPLSGFQRSIAVWHAVRKAHRQHERRAFDTRYAPLWGLVRVHILCT